MSIKNKLADVEFRITNPETGTQWLTDGLRRRFMHYFRKSGQTLAPPSIPIDATRRERRIARRKAGTQATQEKDLWPVGFRLTVAEMFDR